jgi:D-glycero-D-manno-heptose 1,7-bisphosphate phosphatase
MSGRFALLDRDGTINEERDHLGHPDEVELIPGAAAAIRRLRDDLGFGVVCLTNQAEIGRGRLAWATLEAIHTRLDTLLRAEKAWLDGVFVCPHRPEDNCSCRKPAPGLALQAASRFGFEPSDAVVVGDHERDVGLGRAIGATTVLVLTGHGAQEVARAGEEADHVAADLAQAVAIIASLEWARGRSA